MLTVLLQSLAMLESRSRILTSREYVSEAAMSVLGDELRRIGMRTSETEFLKLVVDVVRAMPTATPIHESERDFTAAERETLQRGGFSLGPYTPHADDPVARFVATYTSLLATSLTPAAAAAVLGVDASRVRQRLGAKTLFGVKTDVGCRVPRFQFYGDRLVPGIERVFPRVDPEMHPVAVYYWFTMPSPDLELQDQNLSPRDWLLSGGDPAAVPTLEPGLY
jgi:hypothetical protein